jgi:lipoyl-dependent peroxiredoxin subunit D
MTTAAVALDVLREALPEAARDVRLNIQSVLAESALNDAQRWGVAVAAAIATRQHALREAVLQDASAAGIPEAVIDDARAAAVLMAMNNVYYRFRHMVGKPSYQAKPARLRMNRMARPLGSRVDFELFCLAVSAQNGCEACIRSHEEAVLKGGLTEGHVHDAVRIAAVVQSMAVALG